MRVLFLLACCGIWVGIVGCGAENSADTPELAPVTGVVTLDGEPLENVSVTFESTAGHVSYGKTNLDGRYELSYRDGLMGAAVGENKVRIESVLDAPPPPNYKDPVPAKYNTKSTLTQQVQAGTNEINFELTSK